MKKIRINIPGNEYNVYLGQGISPSIQKIFLKEKLKGDLFLVLDSKVHKLYSTAIKKAFAGYPFKVKSIAITAHEKNKSFESLQKIHSGLIKNKFGRDSIIVAIGGGIIGDITGFAASTYMRGIKYVQVPTTLLAAVDSSVGGKTGINFDGVKNIIGTFYQPETVIIDPLFFNTLTAEELHCGIGEIVKYSFLTDRKYFNYVKKNFDQIFKYDFKVIEKLIADSVKYKGDVVFADEKESGIRKVLNLGHTFAHALEVQQSHKLKHGQAVIVGITCALYLSHKLELISPNNFRIYLDFLIESGKNIKINNVQINQLIKTMQLDKKNRNNEIKFVLFKDIGEIITDMPARNRLVEKSISEAIRHFI